MTVLLTGAGGFIGSALALRFREAGLDVRAAGYRPKRGAAGPDAAGLPAHDAPEPAFDDLLRGVTHIVHCAALNNDVGGASEADFINANAVLTGRLARAAAANAAGRFVFLSSTRAVCGPLASCRIDENTPAEPADAYGRSKREGELAALRAFSEWPGRLSVLRLPPVYGPGMKGNLAGLLKIADTALPLPLKGLGGRRSLLGLERLCDAVLHLLAEARAARPIYVASDGGAASIADIVSAFRQGLGRPRRLFPAPSAGMLGAAMRATGRAALWQSLNASQICDASALVADGWMQQPDSLAGLRDIAAKARRISDAG